MSLELGSVLEELAERRRVRGDANVATMTLAVFFENRAVGELARDRIHALAAKHPGRVIIFDATQNESVQHLGDGEWIEIGARTSTPERLHSVVATLRLPDAPVVLLWIAEGIGGDPRFAALSDHVQTVVCNSSLLDLGTGALRELISYAEQHPKLRIADIPYLRLAPWQESVAILFDDKALLDELFDLRHVEIACGSEPEAYYLLGWLASRLGWTPSAADALDNRFGTRVQFAIVRQGEPRRIQRVALKSSQCSFVAQVDDTNEETILLSVTGPKRHPQRYRPINNMGIAALVERAILWGHNDQVFHDSLVAAGQILAHGKD